MPELVNVNYTCYLCENTLKSMHNLRRHLLQLHQLEIESNNNGNRRWDNEKYVYVEKLGHKEHENILYHYGCPSCLNHFDQLIILKEHVEAEHTSRKRKNDDETSDTTPILIPTSKDIITFTASNNRLGNRQKLSENTIQLLSSIITIVEPKKQPRLKNLSSMTIAHEFLHKALQQPYQELPYWLWTQEHSSKLGGLEKTFVNVIKYVLTDFSSKCNRRRNVVQTNLERTFWIDHVVPLFQIFGDQTGFLHYQWGEVYSQKHAEYTRDLNNTRRVKARYIDGIGYDNKNEERLVIESSGGAIKENLQHAMDDMIKQIHSTMAILTCDINNHLDANFHTMTKLRAFSIHLVKTTLTLSTLRLVDDLGHYEYEELQSCDIPTNFDERTKWLRTFDMMAKLLELMVAQQKVYDTLTSEHDGAIEVPEEDTVQAKLMKK